MSSTDAVLEHHLTAFGEQDMEETLADYSDDSVVVTNLGTFRGLEEIEGLFEDLFAEFSHPEATMNVEQQTVEEEFAYIVWNGETPENSYEYATDTFHIPDDTITFQSFAGKITPKE